MFPFDGNRLRHNAELTHDFRESLILNTHQGIGNLQNLVSEDILRHQLDLEVLLPIVPGLVVNHLDPLADTPVLEGQVRDVLALHIIHLDRGPNHTVIILAMKTYPCAITMSDPVHQHVPLPVEKELLILDLTQLTTEDPRLLVRFRVLQILMIRLHERMELLNFAKLFLYMG
jgi:hypothetical protein